MPRTVSSRAMSLLNESEAQLVLASAPRNLTELTPRALRGKTQRARRLVGKYQDQARRQRREAIGKREPTRGRRAQHNMNTVRKAELIQHALERFEKRLEVLDRKAQRIAATKAVVHAPTRRAKTSVVKRSASGHAPGGAAKVKRSLASTRTATGATVHRAGASPACRESQGEGGLLAEAGRRPQEVPRHLDRTGGTRRLAQSTQPGPPRRPKLTSSGAPAESARPGPPGPIPLRRRRLERRRSGRGR